MEERKQKRLFQRLATGLQIARNGEAFMRFMTLTSPNEPKRPIMRSFEILRKRISRADFVDKKGNPKDNFKGFKFNRYYCLRTAEGNGVLHIIFWGKFIPQNWLSRQWLDIHGAHRADIRACYTTKRSVNGLVGYLLQKYLSDQKIERMSYGWRWAWLGFCRSWKNVKNTYGILRRGSVDSSPTTKWISFKIRYRNASVGAWRCTLWEPPIGSRQIKITRFLT